MEDEGMNALPYVDFKINITARWAQFDVMPTREEQLEMRDKIEVELKAFLWRKLRLSAHEDLTVKVKGLGLS
jgi:hypothetical protein